MKKRFLTFWDYVVKHNVWSKVAAAIIFGILAYIYSLLQGLNYGDLLASILTFKLQVWVYLLGSFILYLLIIGLKRFYSKEAHELPKQTETTKVIPKATPQSPAQPINLTTTTPAKKTTAVFSQTDKTLIFDSNKADVTSYLIIGVKATTKFSDELSVPSSGKFEVKENVLTIDRTNYEGAFVITLLDYYPLYNHSHFIPQNIYGKNPRNIHVSFNARIIKCSHNLILLFISKESKEVINSFDWEIMNLEWVKQSAGFSIPAHEDFYIEFHSKMYGNLPGILQIKDLKIIDN